MGGEQFYNMQEARNTPKVTGMRRSLHFALLEVHNSRVQCELQLVPDPSIGESDFAAQCLDPSLCRFHVARLSLIAV